MKSIIRGSHVPPALRIHGINSEAVAAELTEYIFTGKAPTNKVALAFFSKAPSKPAPDRERSNGPGDDSGSPASRHLV